MAGPVAAVSTPEGEGGIGIVRISGDGAAQIADRVFRSVSGKRVNDIPGYTAVYGAVYDGGEKLDEAVALRYRAPKSYTGEDVVELSCHGGNYVTRRLLRAVLRAGAEAAGPGEFTKRAFLNGKMDLSGAESVTDIINASNERALRAAVRCRDGAVFNAITGIKNRLLRCAARITAFSDEPDEDDSFSGIGLLPGELDDVLNDLVKLERDYDNGKILKTGIYTVITGKPNVGKSTLMNLLARRSISIVTDVPGTTRDVIEESVTLGGLQLRLADTAGIRKTVDAVESEGVKRAEERVSAADLLLAVFDATAEFTSEDEKVLSLCRGRKSIVLLNKTDAAGNADIIPPTGENFTVVKISAKTGAGTDELLAAIEKMFGTDRAEDTGVVLANERQFNCVSKAKAATAEAVKAVNDGVTYDAVEVLIDDAVASLAELTGESVTDAVTDEVFRSFCVGK